MSTVLTHISVEVYKLNVLLVEPYYRRKYPPISLMKISAYHKKRKDTVEYTRGEVWYLDFKPDLIYITSLFTWDFNAVIGAIQSCKTVYPNAEIKVGGIAATMLFDEIYNKTGIRPTRGIIKAFEEVLPDYSLFPELNTAIGFTTRGCPNKCPWCMVQYHEPEYIEIKDWDKYIPHNKKSYSLWDNNFLACSEGHFWNVIWKLKKYNKNVDFNQGLDCRLYTEKRAKGLSKIRIHPIRFSFDSMASDGHIQKAIDLAREHGHRDITVDVLYNYKGTPEEFYYRIKEIKKHKGWAYPMRYQHIHSSRSKGEYIGKHWAKETITAVVNILNSYFSHGMVGAQNWNIFNAAFGKSASDFVDKIEGFEEIPEEEEKNQYAQP